LKQLVTKLKIEDKVEFLNEIEDKEKVELMNKSDCFVFPTLAEGFGLVLIEAMTTCKFVIASDLDVLKEVSNNQLIYFKTDDKLDLLKKMLEVYEGKIISNFEENKSLVFQKYSFDNYIKSYEKIYSSKL
jgi:glycosyltransferase involved in cell wall biosynthesis